MKLRVVVVATVLTLLSLCLCSTQARSNNNNPFDPYPHPPFPEIDCVAVRQAYEDNGNSCPDAPEDPESEEEDIRVCAEYRIWYSSHCQMMSRHCEQMKEGLNLIGTCHHKNTSRVGVHHRRAVPYRKCDEHSDADDYNQYYCPVQHESLCGVYMKTYRSMCHLLYEFCDHLENLNYELAKVISPKMHRSLFRHHNYYDKCGMFSPISGGHTREHFKTIYPHLVIKKNLTKTEQFNKVVRGTMFKYDHVCKNKESQNYGRNYEHKERAGYTLRESETLIHDHSYEKPTEALRAENTGCDTLVKDENVKT